MMSRGATPRFPCRTPSTPTATGPTTKRSCGGSWSRPTPSATDTSWRLWLLTTAAQQFADYMARTLKYGHRADGRTPADRATAADYEYCMVTENIAYAYRSGGFTSEALTDKFFVGWQESPEHRDNMLDEHVTETGVAVAQHEDHPTYFAVQLFARPRSAAIEFTIINRTDRTFDYTLSTESENDQPQEHSLPAGVARRHGQCLPTQLSIDGGNRTATPRHGATYEITSSNDGYKLRRVKGE